MKHGIKFMVVAQEAVGKTTLVSQVEDALLVSTDNKAFTGKVPHYRYSSYQGVEHFTDTLVEKLEAYKEKYDKYPKTVIIDSITHLQNNMERWANDKFTGFNIWSNLSKDILAINAFFEEELVPAGINVVITAHTQYDPDTAKYKINSPGSFGKNGSWLSVVDEAVFIEEKGNKRILHYRTMKFPCRTRNEDLPEHIELKDFSINDHIQLLEDSITESEEFRL